MDRIIAVSESNKRLFKFGRKVPDKVQMIYNGVDLLEFGSMEETSIKSDLGIGDKTVVLGIVGVFDECKGHIYLFQAIERLDSAGMHDMVCLVIGDGREKDSLQRFVMDRHLHNNIKFLGYRDDVPKLLKSIEWQLLFG